MIAPVMASRLPSGFAREQNALDLWVVLAFLIPVSSGLVVNVGGKLYGQDILTLLLLPLFLLQPGARQHLARLSLLWWVLGLWAAGMIVTDIIRATATEDWTRGWAKLFFFGVQLLFGWMFLPRKPRYFMAFALGTGVGKMLSYFDMEGGYQEQFWKFGVGAGLALVVATLCSLPGPFLAARRRFAPIILLVLGLFLLFQGARAEFGVAVLAAGYTALSQAISSRERLRRMVSPVTFGLVILAGLLVTQGLLSLYATAASSGTLGVNAQEKYETQSASDGNLILGGRQETLISLIAIGDSPIIGHGSWARDIYYVRLYAQRRRETGAEGNIENEGISDLIPTHSFIFGSWVEAGILGFVFWAFILGLIVRALYQLLRYPGLPTPLLAVSALALAWNVPFSPFGADARFMTAFQIVALCIIIVLPATVAPRRQGPGSRQS